MTDHIYGGDICEECGNPLGDMGGCDYCYGEVCVVCEQPTCVCDSVGP